MHLNHAYAVSVYADAWGSKFICFDVDVESRVTVAKMIDTLEGIGIPRWLIYVSVSGSKGYHIEVFFSGLIEMRRLRNLYERVIKAGGFDPQKVEFRPTNTAAIKLPLSIHAKTGNVCWYVDRKTLEPIEDAAFILRIEQMPANEFTALIPVESYEQKEHREKIVPRPVRATDATRRMGTAVQEEGTRHNMARNIAVFLRALGKSKEECLTALKDWYEAQEPGLMRTERDEAIRDIIELVEWTFSEKFDPPRNRDPDRTRICSTQMNLVLSQKSRTMRKVIFLLLVRYRIGRSSISCKDAAKTIGVSANAVNRALRRLQDSGSIVCACGKRMRLPDGSFYSESSRYTVPHAEGSKDESRIEITMRELTFDFDRCYSRVLRALIPWEVLEAELSREEWMEYQRHAETPADGGLKTDNKRRIDLEGIPRTLRHERYGEMKAYEVERRMLYPAYDCAKRLGIHDPSAAGSMCDHKENWHVRVVRRLLKDGHPSYQISKKNFIPTEDVRRLATKSKRADKDDIVKWILSPEGDMEGASV